MNAEYRNVISLFSDVPGLEVSLYSKTPIWLQLQMVAKCQEYAKLSIVKSTVNYPW